MSNPDINIKRQRSTLGAVAFFMPVVLSLMITQVLAAKPVWTFIPITETTVTPPATVTYRVVNQSKKSHTLALQSVEGVTQDISAGNCPSPFTLAGLNDSCLLTLNIAENASNATLNEGPIACEADGNGSQLQCYRPSYTDRIRIIARDEEQQFAYIPNIDGDTVSVCPINDGGSFDTCQAFDGGGVFNRPIASAIHPSGNYLYVASVGGGSVASCVINDDRSIGTCTQSVQFINPNTVSINPEATLLYVNNVGNGDLSICPINIDGSLGLCQVFTDEGNTGSAFNRVGSLFYELSRANNTVGYCSLNVDGSLIVPCPTTDLTGLASNIYGLSLSFSGKYIYIANTDVSTVTKCLINSNGSVSTDCTQYDGEGTFSFLVGGALGLNMTSTNGYGYVPNTGNNTVSICRIESNGAINVCSAVSDATFNQPRSVSIFPA